MMMKLVLSPCGVRPSPVLIELIIDGWPVHSVFESCPNVVLHLRLAPLACCTLLSPLVPSRKTHSVAGSGL